MHKEKKNKKNRHQRAKICDMSYRQRLWEKRRNGRQPGNNRQNIGNQEKCAEDIHNDGMSERCWERE